MTTYADIGPYVPEPTFEAWLAKQGFPETYASIFDWEKKQLQQEYNRISTSGTRQKQSRGTESRVREAAQCSSRVHASEWYRTMVRFRFNISKKHIDQKESFWYNSK